ncbi:hypothetical protein Syun_026316 [Stephania yunnanensis]|uniref:GATA-type domain-containing protein n=1 Tax=Stephania yunnanensis TaxID=152371 RepID=A0AAP0HWK9_9MAGN
MTPTYLHSVALPSSPLEHSLEVQSHHQVLISSPISQASSSCSFSSPTYFDLNHQDHGLNYHEDQGKLRASKDALNGGSSDDNDQFIPSYPSIPSMKNNVNYGLKLSMIWKHDHDQDKEGANPSDIGSPNGSTSAKWMSSKMRLMKRMMNSSRPGSDNFHQNQQNPSNNSTNISNGNNIRVCSDCNTTKTPLWRSGPRGPKSLCNACGIRQRKARRAMAAAAISNALHHPNEASRGKVIVNHHKKEKKPLGKGYNHQYKKQRCKLAGAAPLSSAKKLSCFEDFTISLSKNSAFHRVFPQDEKEAAILLMALSYGIVLHR